MDFHRGPNWTSRAYAIPGYLFIRPTVNNSCYRISSEAIYMYHFFIVPVCWPYIVVVHLCVIMILSPGPPKGGAAIFTI